MKTRKQIAVEIRLYMLRTEQTHTMAAIRWQISRSYLSRVLGDKAEPTKNMLADIGYEKTTTYSKVKK